MRVIRLLVVLNCSCVFGQTPSDSFLQESFRPSNGTILISETREMDICDTSKILVTGLYESVPGTCTLNSFNDTSFIRKDTIEYLNPEDIPWIKYNNQLYGEVSQVVHNSRNKDVYELYKTINNETFLSAYITKSSEKSYTVFDPPLLILPRLSKEKDSSTSYMKIWNSNKNEFEKEIKTRSILELKRKGWMRLNNVTEEFFLYEVSILQDAFVSYGENDLILPEAISLKSNLLYLKKSGLAAEWGIRVKQEENPGVGEGMRTKPVAYLEYCRYYIHNQQ